MFQLILKTTGKIGAATFDHEREVIGEFPTKEEALEALQRKYATLEAAQHSKAIPSTKMAWTTPTTFTILTATRHYHTTEIFSVE